MNTTTKITNSDDVIDSSDVIARIAELRDQLTDRWVAGWNMPGYMPDSEPEEFDNFDDAKEYIADELELLADDPELDEKIARDTMDIVKAIRDMTEQDFGQTIGDYHYWITQDGTMGLDEDEQEELKQLEELASDGADYSPDWQYGATLIRDSYFKDYAMELAEDCGMIDSNAKWPNTCIDWDQAAWELRMDYSSIEFDGVTYWTR